MGFSRNTDGWSDATPSLSGAAAPSRIVYVSATGDDASGLTYMHDGGGTGVWGDAIGPGNDPFNPTGVVAPFLTIAAAISQMRNGSPDWILLKKGDTWTGQGFGKWTKSGFSPTERCVIGAYGTGDRPVLETPSGIDGFNISGGGGSPASLDFIFIAGVKLYSYTSDPDNPAYLGAIGYAGIGIKTWNASYIAIEDCHVSFYTNPVLVQTNQPLTYLVSDIEVRRNVIVDAWHRTSAHTQGIYCTGVTGIIIEGNVFDHNGWYGDRASGGGVDGIATIFNHNIYLSNVLMIDVTVKDNIIMRASSHGMQVRGGGEITDNLLIQNPLPVLVGGGDDYATIMPDGVNGLVEDNVVLRSNDINPSNVRGLALDFLNIQTVVCRKNVVAHSDSASVSNTKGARITVASNVPINALSLLDNVFYEHDSGGLSEEGSFPNVVTERNAYWDFTPDGTNYRSEDTTFVDATRDEAAYRNYANGVTGSTFDDFIAEVRKQSRSRDKNEYVKWSAPTINAWIREGYNIGSVPPPITSSGGLVRVRGKALKV